MAKKSEKKDITFEEALAGLEKSSKSLKYTEDTLDNALKSYEEGIEYYKKCIEILDSAKQKVMIYDEELKTLKEFK